MRNCLFGFMFCVVKARQSLQTGVFLAKTIVLTQENDSPIKAAIIAEKTIDCDVSVTTAKVVTTQPPMTGYVARIGFPMTASGTPPGANNV